MQPFLRTTIIAHEQICIPKRSHPYGFSIRTFYYIYCVVTSIQQTVCITHSHVRTDIDYRLVRFRSVCAF